MNVDTFKKHIIFFSRPLSNILDEGNKRLVYSIVRHLNIPATIFTTSDFSLPLSPQTLVAKLKNTFNTTFVDQSKSLGVKLKLFWALVKQNSGSILHIYFLPTRWTSIAIRILAFFKQFRIFISPHNVTQTDLCASSVKALYQKAEKITVLTNFSKNNLIEQGIESKKITKILPFIDQKQFPSPSTECIQRLRNDLQITDHFTVIFPGDYQLINSTQNIVNIVKHVHAKDPSIVFIMACRLKNKKDQEMEEEIRQTLSTHNIHFINTVNNFHEYIAISHAAIFPVDTMAKKFDLPLALLECLLFNLPIIVKDTQPLPEIFNNGDGLIVNNPHAFADAILKLSKQDHFYQHHKHVSEHLKNIYTDKAIIDQHHALYT